MSKVKMRCGRCGKTFTAAKSSKQVFCDSCAAKERAARNAAKVPASAPAAPVQAPRIVGPGAGILDPRLATSAATAAPPDTGLYGAAARVAEREAARAARGHGPGHEHGHDQGHAPASAQSATSTAAPGKPGKPEKGERGEKRGQPHAPAKPREPKPAAPTFTLTDELRQRIEARYLELAQPIEFDGIRTQIAAELRVPKAAVKKTVAELRARMQLPSWWDLKAYHGSDEDLERIRSAYLPLLPVPEIGIHKQIAADLGLDPATVYQGVRRIRAEMRLPQYNPPEAHEGEAVESGASIAPAGETASS